MEEVSWRWRVITLTQAAIQKVKKIIEDQKNPKAALRVGIQGGGCSGFSYKLELELDGPQDNDKIFEFDGLKVCVDPISIMYLAGTTIDYAETLEAAGFRFDNPNVKRTCGCGSSFSTE